MCARAYVCVCACGVCAAFVRLCVRLCVRAFVRAFVRACMRVGGCGGEVGGCVCSGVARGGHGAMPLFIFKCPSPKLLVTIFFCS